MKLLVFVDTHGSETLLKKVEHKAAGAGLLICLGDFTIFGQKQEKILKTIDNFGKLCLVLHGNHETAAELERICKKYRNLLFVHKKILRIAHLIIIGYGGDGFSLRDKPFENIYAPRFAAGVKKYKERIETEILQKPKTILLLHGPPYGSRIDMISDQHCGNKSFRDFYLKYKIDYVFAGHIHESAGRIEYTNGTTLINPGPAGVLLEM